MSPSETCASTAGGTLDQNVISALWEEKKHLNLSNNCRSLGEKFDSRSELHSFFSLQARRAKAFHRENKFNARKRELRLCADGVFFLASLKICFKHFARPRIIKRILELNAGPLARTEHLPANLIWELLPYQFTFTFSTRRKSSLEDFWRQCGGLPKRLSSPSASNKK